MTATQHITKGPGWLTRSQAPINAASDILRVLLLVVTGIVALWQFNTQWNIENERGAREAYREFLLISMENPVLADPALRDFNLSPEENTAYFWYVQQMTHTFEEIFAHVPANKAWTDLARNQIAAHCWFFTSDGYNPGLYSNTFRNTVDWIMNNDERCAHFSGSPQNKGEQSDEL